MNMTIMILLVTLLIWLVFLRNTTRESFGDTLPLWMPTTFRRSRHYDVNHPCLSGHKELFPWVESTQDPHKPIHYHSKPFSRLRQFNPPDLDPAEIFAPKRLF